MTLFYDNHTVYIVFKAETSAKIIKQEIFDKITHIKELETTNENIKDFSFKIQVAKNHGFIYFQDTELCKSFIKIFQEYKSKIENKPDILAIYMDKFWHLTDWLEMTAEWDKLHVIYGVDNIYTNSVDIVKFDNILEVTPSFSKLPKDFLDCNTLQCGDVPDWITDEILSKKLSFYGCKIKIVNKNNKMIFLTFNHDAGCVLHMIRQFYIKKGKDETVLKFNYAPKNLRNRANSVIIKNNF